MGAVGDAVQGTPKWAKVIGGVLLLLCSFLFGQVLPDRIGIQDSTATLRTEVQNLKALHGGYLTRGEFEQYAKGLDQRLHSIEKSLEKIDRKLDR